MIDREGESGRSRPRLETVRENSAECFGLPDADAPLAELPGWGGLRGQRGAVGAGRRSSCRSVERWLRRRRSDEINDEGRLNDGYLVHLEQAG